MKRSEEVSICIAAWQAEPFIERTLDFALGQTHHAVRVLVSVDLSEDATLDLCRARAGRDRRVTVLPQARRLGWAGNVNCLLDHVSTPFFFLYFHDDVVVPQYVERMLAALRSRPEATSAHCDMGHFGASERVRVGFDYGGDAESRLASFLLAPNRGSPLRSLTRAELLRDGLRLPTDAVDGLWANEPYLLSLVGAGPALRVPETLYYRWDQRSGGLTDGWKRLTLEERIDGYAANTATCMGVIEHRVTDPEARRRLTVCLYLHQVQRVRRFERELGAADPIAPERLHPAFAGLGADTPLEGLDEPHLSWASRRRAKLRRIERELNAASSPGG